LNGSRQAPRTGLFDPIWVGESAGAARFLLELDADQPYLRDHRPGDASLFSTVMGLEAAVAAARGLATADGTAFLSDIRVLKPYIATGDGPHVVELRVTPVPQTADEAFDCTLLSNVATGGPIEHLRTRVTFAPPGPSITPAAPMRSSQVRSHPPGEPPSVSQAEIYDLFFHGPAFQVVAGAQYQNGSMTCRLAPELPPSHRGRPPDSELSPRLIEFALQCAGLLELAESGRMMIPDAIARIERFRPLDVDHWKPLVAHATRSAATDPAIDVAAIDVEVVDESGGLVLRVERYRTLPLPFPLNAAAATRLHRRLVG
jgi:hypothetical protein